MKENQLEVDKKLGLERQALYTAQVLEDLKSFFRPHRGQVPVGGALFNKGSKLVVAECGRKFGKTELLAYALYRWAILNPNTYSYYFAPFRDQIKDLVWANGRLPDFLPMNLKNKYVESVNNTEMRINFKNGSFIKCDGSDNYEKARGYSATGLTVYDEAKDHNPNFHDAFEPNLAITDSPLLVVGTPGDGDEPLTRLAELAKITQTGAYFNMPSHMNPHISAEFLKRKEGEYRLRGEYDLFEREYLAKRVKIGSKHIFPMLSKKHVRKHEDILEYIMKSRKDYDFYIGYDPGSVKCFAVLFVAIHRYDKRVFVLDEIYATKLGENSVKKIVPVSLGKVRELNDVYRDWMATYDYAAAWFYSELISEFKDFPIAMFPCQKDLKNKEEKLSLIKDMLNANLIAISDRCVNFYSEMDGYKLDDNGKVIKDKDHLIDGFRYILNLANYYSLEGARPVDDPLSLTHIKLTPEKDMKAFNGGGLYGDIDDSLFS